ncbi:MAG: DNA polymerase III subunit alpha [PS1 clade bacterium]|uniref:DNA polymerase III subunit alpha n=1 Tax=PS1 clade bacterium TaxID=2175152 RepID=A0A937L2Q2_9PROT|nr:DNA polymerase III subunit alpha [PS1 clade bacterium]
MRPKFVHLRTHSAYSLLEGALPVKTLTQTALAARMPALAVTDRNNLFGALEFAETASGLGVQPIIGATLNVRDGDEHGDLAFLVKNQAGYTNLMALISAAHLNSNGKEGPGVTLDEVADAAAGLICLTGGPDGLVNQLLANNQTAPAESKLTKLNNIFEDNLYVELQRYAGREDDEIEAQLIDFAYAKALPLVATNQAYFASEDDYRAHDALICIAEGRYINEQDRRRLTPDHRLKSAEEMCALFADLPEALENTVEIAQRCAFRPTEHAPILPAFSKTDELDELRKQAAEGLTARLQQVEAAADETAYRERLDFELKVIADMGFPGYFLIVADFIKWAKAQNIAVGPGRGSGAGSVVAWALTITDLDPLRFGLLFERFLNPERVSMPDFDIDFCQSRRDEVISYVQQKYGRDQVAQIITFGKLQARAVLRDVGRVLQMPYGQIDRLCKMVPNNPANPVTLQEAIDQEPRLQAERDSDPQVAELIEISLKLEGLYRHASTHAAGVVIGDRPLQQLVPLYRDPKSDMPVTQFNMKWVEKAGLVKFDFLGLKTLTVLEKAVELLAETGVHIDINNLPLDDAASYELMGRGDTVGVFQLESAGMRDVLRKMKPDKFEDIIALVALYRPGPMDNIPLYIARKKGEEELDYLYDSLQPILQETYGVMIYQEQVMQIAQTLSGYSLGEADLLRRAMGKKIKEEMAAQKARFVDGAVENGVPKNKAAQIFDQVDRFAGYGFNKSHAAAYALIAYQTAWLKANHPVAFYAASMSLDFERTEKLNIFKQDAAKHDITLRIPDVNCSEAWFAIDGDQVFYALSAIRNVGSQAMQLLVEERKANGPFKDVFDFARRTAGIGLNKRLLEHLIAAGALDSLEPDRAKLIGGIEILLGEASITQSEKESQQNNLFGEADVSESATLPPPLVPWSTIDRLTHEFNAIGFFLSGHPLDDYKPLLKRTRVASYEELEARVEKEVMVAGAVIKVDERKSKKGNPFAFITLSDPTGQFEMTAFSEVLNGSREILDLGALVVATVTIEREDGEMRLLAQSLRPVDDVVANTESGLRIFVERPEACDGLRARLQDVEQPKHKRGGEVSLVIMTLEREVEMRLPKKYAINPRIAGAIKAVPGVLHVDEI